MAHSFTLVSWLSFNLGGSTDKKEQEHIHYLILSKISIRQLSLR